MPTPVDQAIDLTRVRATFVEFQPGDEWVVRFLVRSPFRSDDKAYTKQQIINALAVALKGSNWWDGLILKYAELSVHFPTPLTTAERSKKYTGPAVEDWPLWGRDRRAILAELARITPVT